MYLTPSGLMDRFGPRELAELSTADDLHIVDSELLRLTITGGDRSAFSAAEIATADEALARIQMALTEASAIIDSFLRPRYALPLVPVPPPLPRLAGDIARFLLMDDRATEEARSRYEAALKMLAEMRDGRLTLGPSEPAVASAQPGLRRRASRMQFADHYP